MNTGKQREPSNNVSIISQNVQSIGNCVNELNAILNSHPNCHYLTVTEHWKTEDQLKTHNLENFNLATYFCRDIGQHGGAAIYVRKGIKYSVCQNLNALAKCGVFECAAIECSAEGHIIMSIYRPPYNSNIEEFYGRLEDTLELLAGMEKTAFITGDFNIDLKDNKKAINRMKSLLSAYSFEIVFDEYTRITSNTRTCIDNVLTNFKGVYSKNVLYTSISDHLGLEFSFTKNISNKKSPRPNTRIFSANNINVFKLKLKSQDWKEVYFTAENNVDKQWNIFMDIFLKLFYECFPLKSVRENKKMNEVMNDPEVEEYKNKLSAMQTILEYRPELKKDYDNIKKKYNQFLVNKRADICHEKITKSDNKMKSMWGIHKELVGNNDFHVNLFEDGSKDLANRYNSYLLNAIPKMQKNNSKPRASRNIPRNTRSLFLTPVTAKEIIKLSQKLKNKFTSGDDEIPTNLIKTSIEEISEVISYIMNNSFKHGIFPKQLKLATIVPIYKKGDRGLFGSYRPISILPSFSKLFEKAMSDRLVSFLTSFNMLSKNQHGYVKGRSVETAILQFTENIIKSFEKNEILLGIFIDLSKAFDSLSHKKLLEKLESFGIRGNVLRWFESYLRDRQQRTAVKKEGKTIKSDIKINNTGVPQGSILGPILFIIFINDIERIFDAQTISCFMTIFADDTNLLVSDSSYPRLLQKMFVLLEKIQDWFEENDLILNAEKTKVVLFRTPQQRIQRPDKITMLSQDLKPDQCTKFLGVFIDEHLNWTEQIVRLSKKLSSITYSLKTLSKYLNEKSLKVFYFANFESLMKFGLIFYGSSSELIEIFRVQKRVIRCIFKMNYRESCRGIFKRNRIMTVYGLYIYEILIYVFKNIGVYSTCSSFHSYQTRQLNLSFPRHKLSITEKHPTYACIKYYNNLPVDIRNCQTLNLFKKKLKSFLLDLEPYSLDDF